MADYKIADKAYRIVICDHILDNIYGQVGLTEVEKRIERLPVFKRLHSLSQLGLVNWIFPCALHNRYVHSIGVMYVAGEMATRINSNMGKQFLPIPKYKYYVWRDCCTILDIILFHIM